MKPKTTVGNMHICPKCNGYIAHVQEPLSNSGTPNVFINGKPAILKNNMCVCVDSHDIIAQGDPTVLINGKPASTQKSMTDYEISVAIGDPPAQINSATSNTKVTIPPKRILFLKMPIINRIGTFLKVKRPI